MKRYNPKEIEPKWQQQWELDNTYVVNFDSKKPKYVGFGMFNYPSGAGIHVGHVRNFTIPDVITRVKRQQGYESYQPVGWDSFGLPAENYAIKSGVAPQVSIKTAIEKYHQQYRAMGWAMDWTKEIDTTEPEYYRWTQWCFAKLFEHGLAYQQESPQWWCDQCKTVLADEQVIAGKCWRHDSEADPMINKRSLKQWFFKITDYADEMLEATDDLNWTQSVKSSQKSWIGRSVGAEIEFKIDGTNEVLKVFTTRPDTIFGATFMVLAPEHPIVQSLVVESQKVVIDEYRAATSRKSEVQRQQDADKEKTGVFTGSYAVNPANNQKIPIWIADYVLMGYGTGAIMAVPAHDERDNDFAKKFELPIIQVVEPVYIQTTDPGSARKDLDFVERNAITAIVKHSTEDKFIGLIWNKVDWDTFITGGVEPNQTPEEAARAEIREETGYINLRLIKQLTNTHAQFFHVPKNENRYAHFSGFYFELTDESQVEVAKAEQQKHSIKWLSREEMDSFRLPESHRYLWNEINDGAELFNGEGILTNSDKYDGMTSSEAREKIVADLETQGVAGEKVNYKMRDWLISRQRYWGAPIPIIHCEKDGPILVPDSKLPVVLPEVENYRPTGGNVTALAGVDAWVNVPCPKCGEPAKRETDTMDGYVCSSWYFLRYLDPTNNQKAWDEKQASKWMPVDCYNGGDHATAHLLYARFFNRFFHKLGLIGTKEPFKKMIFNGKIKAGDGSAFSKSKGNGIDPLAVIEQGYGADAIRLYQMFAAPVELDVLWDEQGIPGAYRFLSRVWHITQEWTEAEASETPEAVSSELLQATHKAIKKVSEEIEADRFNTAIAGLMELTNRLYKISAARGMQKSEPWKSAIESLLQMLAPFAPHITEELWHDLGNNDTIHIDHWPVHDERFLTSNTMKIVVHVNGRVRATLEVDSGANEEQIVAAAQANEKVAEFISGNPIKKTIYVPAKLVNFVV